MDALDRRYGERVAVERSGLWMENTRLSAERPCAIHKAGDPRLLNFPCSIYDDFFDNQDLALVRRVLSLSQFESALSVDDDIKYIIGPLIRGLAKFSPVLLGRIRGRAQRSRSLLAGEISFGVSGTEQPRTINFGSLSNIDPGAELRYSVSVDIDRGAPSHDLILRTKQGEHVSIVERVRLTRNRAVISAGNVAHEIVLLSGSRIACRTATISGSIR